MPQNGYLSTDPTAGEYLSTDPSAGTPVSEPSRVQAAAPEPKSWWQKLMGPKTPHINNLVADLVIGGVKGAANTVIGLGQMAHQIPGVSAAVDSLYGTPGLSKSSFPVAREAVKPEGAAETAGYAGEQIAEFFTPTGMAGKAAKVAEVVKAGGITQAQTGSPTAAVTAGALTGGINAVVPKVTEGVNALGHRIEDALVKATKRDIEDGFTSANVFKHNVGGTLEQTYQKSIDKIKTLSQTLQQTLRASKGMNSDIDVIGALNAAAATATGNAARTVGQNQALGKAAATLLDELEPVLQQSGQQALATGKIDLVTANQLKQGIGELGAWKHDPTGRVVSADDKAMETVANAFYDELKKSIEAKAIGPVRHINKQIGELLGIKHAVARRIPIEQRSNVLNLGDLIGFGTGNWGLSLANRFLKSGQAAEMFSKAGPSTVPGKVAAGATSTVTQGSR